MRKISYLLAFVYVLMAVSAFSAFSSVNGTVTDTTGAPVIGALVTFTDESDADISFSGTSGSDGGYVIDNDQQAGGYSIV
jgi:carboxypeptidase family protein